ncbi:MAG: hypothetical protein ACYTGZ_10165 [Planctomycetota bacterium]|jgi:hypothetical protein
MIKRLLCLLLATTFVFGDVVVLRDRSILEGEAKEAGAAKVAIGGRTIALDELLLWEDAEGQPKNSPTLRDQMRAYDALHDREMLARCQELLPKAIEAKKGGSARVLLGAAERLGMEPDAVDKFAEQIGGLGEETDKSFDLGARDAFARLLAEKAKANGALKEQLRGLELLRASLVRDDDQKLALETLKAVAPGPKKTRRRRRRRKLTPEQEKEAAKQRRIWLDWQVDVLPSKFGRIRLLGSRHPEMDRAKELWRTRDKETGVWSYKKIHGMETSEIVFLTPLNKTDIVKTCVSIARFTSRALEELFKTDKPKRGTTDPLVIYFYENHAQYVALSGRGRGVAPNPTIAMSAGHYVSTENVSRFFWPDCAGAEESVRETFVHELTHHWIQERCPRWSRQEEAQGEAAVTIKGAWIVEGIAVFMQEARFDLERGTWSHFNPHSLALDSVASIGKEGNLMPWTKLYTLTKIELHKDVETGKIQATYKGKWNIFPIPMSEMLLFYKQSGSTCAFLYWGENGKYREKFLDYVKAYYTGNKEGTDIEKAFGMTPDELGAKVEKFAQQVVDGWRPKDA